MAGSGHGTRHRPGAERRIVDFRSGQHAGRARAAANQHPPVQKQSGCVVLTSAAHRAGRRPGAQPGIVYLGVPEDGAEIRIVATTADEHPPVTQQSGAVVVARTAHGPRSRPHGLTRGRNPIGSAHKAIVRPRLRRRSKAVCPVRVKANRGLGSARNACHAEKGTVLSYRRRGWRSEYRSRQRSVEAVRRNRSKCSEVEGDRGRRHRHVVIDEAPGSAAREIEVVSRLPGVRRTGQRQEHQQPNYQRLHAFLLIKRATTYGIPCESKMRSGEAYRGYSLYDDAANGNPTRPDESRRRADFRQLPGRPPSQNSGNSTGRLVYCDYVPSAQHDARARCHTIERGVLGDEHV